MREVKAIAMLDYETSMCDDCLWNRGSRIVFFKGGGHTNVCEACVSFYHGLLSREITRSNKENYMKRIGQ